MARRRKPSTAAKEDAEPTPAARGPVGRLLRGLVIVLVSWHVLCVLATGAKPVRDAVAPINGWYVDGLKLTNTWGMFSKAPKSAETLVIGVLEGGETTELSTSYANRKGFTQRIVDSRIRKIQAKLENEGDRKTFGVAYLDYWCREARAAHPGLHRVRLVVRQPERFDDEGNTTTPASEKIVMGRKCPKERQ